MTKDEMKAGFARGCSLNQEEWSTPEEIKAVDELVAEGFAEVIKPWGYNDNFQCSYRKVRGKVAK
jgi:hypothetical protein